MSAAEKMALPEDEPRTAAEIRAELRTALVDELGDRGDRLRRRTFDFLGTEPTRPSAADLLYLMDELVAQVRREERAGKDGTR
jgi:hypothetical protein